MTRLALGKAGVALFRSVFDALPHFDLCNSLLRGVRPLLLSPHVGAEVYEMWLICAGTLGGNGMETRQI